MVVLKVLFIHFGMVNPRMPMLPHAFVSDITVCSGPLRLTQASHRRRWELLPLARWWMPHHPPKEPFPLAINRAMSYSHWFKYAI